MKTKPITPYQHLKDAAVKFFNALCYARNTQKCIRHFKDASNSGNWDLSKTFTTIQTAQALGYDVIAEIDGDGIKLVARKRVNTRDHDGVRYLSGTGDTKDGML